MSDMLETVPSPRPRFALIGLAGFISRKSHVPAIKEINGELVMALDPAQNVGWIQEFFPRCKYFNQLERFQVELWKRQVGLVADPMPGYMVICTPNYLHHSQAVTSMLYGLDVICEKPLVIEPHNLASLRLAEQRTGRRVWVVLQLRHDPQAIQLRERFRDGHWRANLVYHTPREDWFHYATWKVDERLSGGLIYNIGIHFLDLLLWIFGPCQGFEIDTQNQRQVSGHLFLERATVKFDLQAAESVKPERSLIVNDERLDFGHQFTNLHAEVYRQILAGQGCSIDDAAPSIQLAHDIRNSKPRG